MSDGESFWDKLNPTIDRLIECPECGVDSACLEIRYGYPSPTYWKDSRGYLFKNHYPSSTEWINCYYCGYESTLP
jgi:DNA-directed RNA polymerase subunit RPC12/RpoP